MTRSNAIGRGPARAKTAAAPQLRVVDEHPQRISQPAGEDAPARVRAFFAEQLPWAIAKRADLFNCVRGSLALFVEGAGCWTIRFGNHASEKALEADATFESDCVTVFSVAGFVALLDGRTDGPTPVMIGDGRLLSRLGQLMLEPARGQLGARLNK